MREGTKLPSAESGKKKAGKLVWDELTSDMMSVNLQGRRFKEVSRKQRGWD